VEMLGPEHLTPYAAFLGSPLTSAHQLPEAGALLKPF
jgi:hypothetical protein